MKKIKIINHNSSKPIYVYFYTKLKPRRVRDILKPKIRFYCDLNNLKSVISLTDNFLIEKTGEWEGEYCIETKHTIQAKDVANIIKKASGILELSQSKIEIW